MRKIVKNPALLFFVQVRETVTVLAMCIWGFVLGTVRLLWEISWAWRLFWSPVWIVCVLVGGAFKKTP